ncbi:LacI family DNA-binding transcriptional regulator [Pacificimonas sp. WHA3]|uniref:LacI family DNA-binding transcriptional regulator n=1 Tax=Pacificimonas pallii TaxID=2827236 RepID=A0ABS6SI97_9SPHN|nr:LacI family DNA-binding transcriptional regulator [Pacificimonas pallii]MBV7257778.1 LacI family DNA-binding transcriptional regulator [Pacificimonas pallii]
MADSKGGQAGVAARTTMIDVANAAGVSFKTVSRVLNGEAYVRESTRGKVLEAARSLDYQFNHAARSLRSGSAQIVSLLTGNQSRAYTQSVHLGALQQCQQAGVHVVVESAAADIEVNIEALERSLLETAPMGVVVTPPLCDNAEIIALLERHHFRYVLISPVAPGPGTPHVGMDDEAAAREMTALLIGLGHRQIGFIQGDPDDPASSLRRRGYLSALADAHIAAEDTLVVSGRFDWDSGLVAADRLLDLDDPPSAIFAANDDMAAAVIAAAYRRDMRVPGDLSVAGFGDTSVASVISPQLTTVYQPIVDMVSEAVRILTGVISGADVEVTQMTLPYRLVERGSTGKC